MAKIVRFEADTLCEKDLIACKSRKQNDDETTNFEIMIDGLKTILSESDAVDLAEMILEVYGKRTSQSTQQAPRIVSSENPKHKKILRDIEANRDDAIEIIMINKGCTFDEAIEIYESESQDRLHAAGMRKPPIDTTGKALSEDFQF
jgi:hypothetical protein